MGRNDIETARCHDLFQCVVLSFSVFQIFYRTYHICVSADFLSALNWPFFGVYYEYGALNWPCLSTLRCIIGTFDGCHREMILDGWSISLLN